MDGVPSAGGAVEVGTTATGYGTVGVRPHDEAALEAEQQVLADRVDAEQAAAVELLRDPAYLGARVRRLDLELLADERLQPASRPMERISFRHGVRIGP